MSLWDSLGVHEFFLNVYEKKKEKNCSQLSGNFSSNSVGQVGEVVFTNLLPHSLYWVGGLIKKFNILLKFNP